MKHPRVKEIAPGRWSYRIEYDKGNVLVDSRGPGGKGYTWEECCLRIARFNTAIQCY